MKIDIAYLYKKCIFTLLKGTKVRENRIFFESFHGEKYSDSIKVLYEYMKTKRNDMQDENYARQYGVTKDFCKFLISNEYKNIYYEDKKFH